MEQHSLSWKTSGFVDFKFVKPSDKHNEKLAAKKIVNIHLFLAINESSLWFSSFFKRIIWNSFPKYFEHLLKFPVTYGDPQERVYKLVRPYITWYIWTHALEIVDLKNFVCTAANAKLEVSQLRQICIS